MEKLLLMVFLQQVSWGLTFFFILSGFIIYYIHHQGSPNVHALKRYGVKRFLRLYPPFILISLIMLSAYSFLPFFETNDRNISLISTIFLIPDPFGEPALTVSWTLMHELLFYLIFIVFYFFRTYFLYLMVFSGGDNNLFVVVLSGWCFLFRFFVEPL